jgi:hypothetical protein
VSIDGYTVWGMLGDWADISDDPDRRQWADLFHPDTVRGRRVKSGVAFGGSLSAEAGSAPRIRRPARRLHLTADRDEIAVLARRIIASHAHNGSPNSAVPPRGGRWW